ncbi:unnamed protein product [Rotaria sp. Silwood1]|nr:unnamed protein product [Rotaria sp. Silwood1]CAF3368161.1 unnamed protein product [Rotaria sp. Silwood1]CAF3402612.1 unnamed protein product [Rotaria sp. Silwood1]CAF4512862.1 unnamed protein product [Rotaria sp. Silwood1]
MQQQVVSLMTLHTDDKKIDCFSYIVKQCNFYVENFGIIVKRVLCKPWPLLSKQSIRKKKKQKSTNPHTCETITPIDVISLFQSNNLHQQSLTVTSIQSKTSIKRSKPQISRQLLESLVTVIDSQMPLAQNYKDDVSLLESEAALSKVKVPSINTEFNICQESNTKVNCRTNLDRNGLSSNIAKATTNTNISNMLADDDLPETVSTVSNKS